MPIKTIDRKKLSPTPQAKQLTKTGATRKFTAPTTSKSSSAPKTTDATKSKAPNVQAKTSPGGALSRLVAPAGYAAKTASPMAMFSGGGGSANKTTPNNSQFARGLSQNPRTFGTSPNRQFSPGTGEFPPQQPGPTTPTTPPRFVRFPQQPPITFLPPRQNPPPGQQTPPPRQTPPPITHVPPGMQHPPPGMHTPPGKMPPTGGGHPGKVPDEALNLLLLMMQQQQQSQTVNIGSPETPQPLPWQADRLFEGRDPNIRHNGQGDILELLLSNFT